MLNKTKQDLGTCFVVRLATKELLYMMKKQQDNEKEDNFNMDTKEQTSSYWTSITAQMSE